MSTVRVCVFGTSVILYSTLGSNTRSALGTTAAPVLLQTEEGVNVTVTIQNGDAVFSVNGTAQSAIMLQQDFLAQCAALSSP